VLPKLFNARTCQKYVVFGFSPLKTTYFLTPRLTHVVQLSTLVLRQYWYELAPLLSPHDSVRLVGRFVAPFAGLLLLNAPGPLPVGVAA
jgi:hypothetical protein